jgi:hypothetical protein
MRLGITSTIIESGSFLPVKIPLHSTFPILKSSLSRSLPSIPSFQCASYIEPALFQRTLLPVTLYSISISRFKMTSRVQYSSQSVQRRSKHSVLSSLVDQLRLMYYQYEVTFSPYVMTSGEKFIMNSIVVALFILLVLASYSYMLPFLVRASGMLFWPHTRSDSQSTIGDVGNMTIGWKELGSPHLGTC